MEKDTKQRQDIANEFGMAKQAINKLKRGAARSQKKKKSEKSQEYEKEGDIDTANEDFDEIAEDFGVTANVEDKGNGVRIMTLPDGSTVSVRPHSTEGSATIQVDRPGTRKHTKFRYK
ncbi:MAG: hypothetical protein SW833_16480 [Cyanobacteriota bacterium]|nr:hypothetical protein [Cyanobacteriota bacterium]